MEKKGYTTVTNVVEESRKNGNILDTRCEQDVTYRRLLCIPHVSKPTGQ